MEPEIKEITPVNNTPMPKPRNRKKILIGVGIFFSALLIFGLLITFLIGMPAYKAYGDAKKAYTSAKEIKTAVNSQDIQKIIESIKTTQTQLSVLKNDVQALSWTQKIPFFGGYTSDALHGVNAAQYSLEAADIAAKAVEPYTDLLGLKGKGTFTGGTAEDRIALAVSTLDKVTPQIDPIIAKMDLVKKEVDQIDPNRYPESIKGVQIKNQLSSGKLLLDQASSFLTEAKPLVTALPKLAGADGEKKYLILFQNDAEIRPTGGFITAYAVFRIDKGRIHIDSADDIYKLDSTITKNVKPPQAIIDHLNESVWHIRNANFSPDFAVSMQNFTTLYNSSPEKKKIDGIIAMDTQVLLKIMEVIGPIAAYNTNFTTEKVPQCDCASIIWELEKYADEPTPYIKKDRKDIIGVLLQAIMQKAMKAPKQMWAPLFQNVFASMQEKHLLVYLYDANAQKGLVALGAGGVIKDYNGDYLHINDANLGGAKSNLYVSQTVTQDVTVTSSGTETNLVIQYRHNRQGDNCSLERKSGVCLSGTLRDYLRVYLPKGSQIIQVRGFETNGTSTSKGAAFEDLNKTVIDGYFTVVPLGIAKIQIKYKTPLVFNNTYRELIQKQPGTNAFKYTLTVNGKTQQFDLLQDKEVEVKL